MPDLTRLPPFGDDGELQVVVEAPRGCGLKLKYEPAMKAFTVSKALPVGVSYPFDWGFVPGTLAPDGDPLDALVLQDVASYPGVVLPCRVIGMVVLDENKKKKPHRERNDRLIAVPLWNERLKDVLSAKDLNPALRAELENFFINTTFHSIKDPHIHGWLEADEALDVVKQCAKAAKRGPRK